MALASVTSSTAVLVLLVACGASTSAVPQPLSALPATATTAMLAGPLCTGEACRCRDDGEPGDGGAGTAPDGAKRFEIRIGPSQHAQWVTLDGQVLYKGPERPSECFYVDLGPGEHTLRLRASNESGVQAVVRVAEYGEATGSWYSTFDFVCGDGGVCDRDGLEAQRERYAAVKDGKHDPCGSTLVKGLTWSSGRLAEGEVPADVQADLILAVYKFVPHEAHGMATCLD